MMILWLMPRPQPEQAVLGIFRGRRYLAASSDERYSIYHASSFQPLRVRGWFFRSLSKDSIRS